MGKRKRKQILNLKMSGGTLNVMLPIVLVVTGIVFLVMAGPALNLDSELTSGAVTMLPGVSIIIVGIVMLFRSHGNFVVMSCFALGIGTALTFSALDTLDILSVQMMSGLVLWQVQLILMLLFIVLGVVLAQTGGRR